MKTSKMKRNQNKKKPAASVILTIKTIIVKKEMIILMKMPMKTMIAIQKYTKLMQQISKISNPNKCLISELKPVNKTNF